MKRILLPFRKIMLILNPKQRFGFVLLVLGSIVYALLETLGVSVILPLVKAMLEPQELLLIPYIGAIFQRLGIENDTQIICFMVFGTIILYLIKNLYFSFFAYKKTQFACKTEREISLFMMKSYMNRGYLYFLKKNTNEIMQGIHDDVYQVYLALNSVMYIISKSLIVMCVGLFMLFSDWKMATVLLLAAIICLLIVVCIFRKRMRKAGELERKYIVIAKQILMQTIQGIKEVFVMRKQKEMIGNYSKNLEESQRQQVKRQMGQELPAFLIETMCITAIMLVLLVRVISLNNPTEFIAILATFAVGAFRIMPAISNVSTSLNAIATYLPSINVVYENIVEAREFNKRRFQVDTKDDERFQGKTFEKNVTVENISFRYDENSDLVLNQLNMSFGKGESIGIVGTSGAGKSTLADIILGVTAADGGDIKMDGVSISLIPNYWGSIINFVPQTIYLSDASIRENVAFGVSPSDIDDEQVKRVLEQANILDFVNELPRGIETEIGERGVRLSGGQRQRIGIARALYSNPMILVMDEATSALDNDTEQSVMEAIESLQGQITMIIVAHRLTTIKNCTRIYRVANGKAETTTYEELINN